MRLRMKKKLKISQNTAIKLVDSLNEHFYKKA